MSPIQRAIQKAGGLSDLATRLGVTPQVVVNWRRRGVPAEQVLKIEAATDGKVTRHELRPDLYPKEVAA